jgi:hypothetical protein
MATCKSLHYFVVIDGSYMQNIRVAMEKLHVNFSSPFISIFYVKKNFSNSFLVSKKHLLCRILFYYKIWKKKNQFFFNFFSEFTTLYYKKIQFFFCCCHNVKIAPPLNFF